MGLARSLITLTIALLPVQSLAQANNCEVEDWKYAYQNIM